MIHINEFRVHDDQGKALRDLIASFVPLIEATEDCRSCRSLQHQDDPTRLVFIEEGESVEAHRASAQAIPPETR